MRLENPFQTGCLLVFGALSGFALFLFVLVAIIGLIYDVG